MPVPSQPRMSKTRSTRRPWRRLLCERLEDRTVPNTYTVLNTDDGGAGSLRQAILDANANPGADSIVFNIDGTGVHTIQPLQGLPRITDPVVINGYSQPGAHCNTLAVGDDAVLNIAIDGTMANYPGATHGLYVSAANTTVQGLEIYNFQGSAIYSEGADGTVVQGNFLNTDGASPLGLGGSVGVSVAGGANVTVGGASPAARNVIGVGPGSTGISDFASGTVVAGNYIGLNAAGTAALTISSNPDDAPGFGILAAGDGITIGGSATGAGNVIANGIAGAGVGLTGGHSVSVIGNFIGTNAAGTADAGGFPWGGYGLVDYCDGSTISGNVCSGWTGYGGLGINVAASGALVVNNYVGTDVTGQVAIPNETGIWDFEAQSGGTDRNVIADNTINFNTGNGIFIDGYGSPPVAHTISDNTIAFNGGAGVDVHVGTSISIRGNSIHDNAGPGIDLGDDGVTPNDSAGHVGPNDYQNFPVLSSAVISDGSTAVTGTLTSTPNSTFALDFYANPSADPTGYGQGQTYLGSFTVQTDATGAATFTAPLSTLPPAGQVSYLSATATNTTTNDTSEFSADLAYAPASAVTPTTLQQVLTASNPLPVVVPVDPGTVGDVVQAINDLASQNVTVSGSVSLNLAPGAYSGETVNLPAGMTLYIDGSATNQLPTTIDPDSPAFTVVSGNVIVSNVTFVTVGDAPTIFVTGGSLTLRNCIVEESTGANQAAIQVTGGTVDLGTVADPGGNTIDINGPGAFVRNSSGSPVSAVGTAFTVNGAPLQAGSLSGVAWKDFNDDGQVDFGENGIHGVNVNLTGTDDLGNAVNLSQSTDADGAYVFLNLRPGNYYITETQPAGYLQGIDTVGTAGGSLAATDQFLVPLGPGVSGLNYNFGEQPAATGPVQRGQSAGIGFWNNKNGQALIKAFNGSVGTELADWLAATMPNTFGIHAGANNLTGKSNAFVANLFQQDFVMKCVKLDAQVLATALNVYATNATLDSAKAAAAYGFTVSGGGEAGVNVGSNGAAFGVTNNTTLTVIDLLKATDAQSINGVLYGNNSTKRNEANTVYSLINQGGGL